MQNLILTGGSGLLALNWAFNKKDDCRLTLLLNKRKISINGVNFLFINLESKKTIYDFLSNQKNCVVIHCAANTSVEECENNPKLADKTNAQISIRLAKICFKLKIRFVHISSDHIFSGLNSFSSEESKINPQNVYAVSKSKAEAGILKENPDALIIRTNFFCWGTPYRSSFSDFLVNSLRKKENIFLYTNIFYTPIYSKYLIELVHELISRKISGIFNVVGNERVSKYSFGKMAFKSFGGDLNLITQAKYDFKKNLIKRPLDMSLSNHKLKTYLNLKIVDLETQIEQLKLDEIKFKSFINLSG